MCTFTPCLGSGFFSSSVAIFVSLSLSHFDVFQYSMYDT
jgi:hypothetical protein